MDFLKFLPYIFQAMELIGPIRQAIRDGVPVLELLKTKGPSLIDFVQSIGKQLFPNLTPENATQAGALIAFDPATVKVVQAQLNHLGASPALVVDGHYGNLTKAAVTAFQTAHALTPDGWAGKLTTAALATEAGKLPA